MPAPFATCGQAPAVTVSPATTVRTLSVDLDIGASPRNNICLAPDENTTGGSEVNIGASVFDRTIAMIIRSNPAVKEVTRGVNLSLDYCAYSTTALVELLTPTMHLWAEHESLTIEAVALLFVIFDMRSLGGSTTSKEKVIHLMENFSLAKDMATYLVEVIQNEILAGKRMDTSQMTKRIRSCIRADGSPLSSPCLDAFARFKKIQKQTARDHLRSIFEPASGFLNQAENDERLETLMSVYEIDGAFASFLINQYITENENDSFF